MDNKFPFPLDTDIEEEVTVKKNAFDPKTGKITSTYQLEKVTTRYMDIKPELHRCKTGEHNFEVKDGGRGIFSCTKCSYSRKVYPHVYRFENNQLINKFTNKAV